MTKTSGNKMSAAMQRDARAAQREQHAGRAAARAQRVEEHRAGVDHGKGCTHCDVTHGR